MLTKQRFADRYKAYTELFTKDGEMDRQLGYAREALRLAQESNNPLMLSESESALAALEAFNLLNEISILNLSEPFDEEKKVQMADKINVFDRCAHMLRISMTDWGNLIVKKQEADGLWPKPADMLWRLRMGTDALLDTADTLAILGAERGIVDRRPEARRVKIGEWTQPYEQGKTLKEFDVTQFIPEEGGSYYLMIENLQGYTHIITISLINVDPITEKREVLTEAEYANYYIQSGRQASPVTIPARSLSMRIYINGTR